MTQVKNSKCDKTKKKTQNVTKLKKSKFYKIRKKISKKEIKI